MNICVPSLCTVPTAQISASILFCSSVLSAATITLSNPPLTVSPGQSYEITATYHADVAGVVNLQLLKPDWSAVDGEWKSISAGSGSYTVTIDVPTDIDASLSYHYQAALADSNWDPALGAKDLVWSVSVASTQSSIDVAAPVTMIAGNTYNVRSDYTFAQDGYSLVQLFDSSWGAPIVEDMSSIDGGSDYVIHSLTIPESTPAGSDYIWQGMITNNAWSESITQTHSNITVVATPKRG